MTIGELLTKYGSDKDKEHSYGPVYNAFFEPIQNSVTAILEVGIRDGCSLRAWQEYFPNARVVGIDNHSDLLNEGRIESFRADSTNLCEVDNVLKDSTFDIIIDDGCHWYKEQTDTWRNLYHRVRPGGLYIIEDLQEDGALGGFEELGAIIHNRRTVKCRADDVLAVFHKT